MFEQRVNSDVLTVSTVNSQDQVTQKPLRDSVKQALKNYFAQLNGQDVNDLYELVPENQTLKKRKKDVS